MFFKRQLIKNLFHNDLVELAILAQNSLYCQSEKQIKELVSRFKNIFSFENLLFAQAKVPEAFFSSEADIRLLNVSYPAD